ncbi:hypothetical protein Tco_0443045 [Tanacetum coccineum]
MDLETAQTNTTAKLPLLKQENENSFKPAAQTTTNADGSSTTLIPGPVTADEKTQKKLNVKAISMLLMALPNEHLLTFNQYKDAKTLFAAIQIRFGGNNATKKTSKTLLKQMYENFSAPSIESLDYIFNRLQKIRNKPDLDTISFDDLYNNFKIVKQEVKGTASLISTANLSDDTVYAFLASQPNGSQLVHEDLEQIHEDDLEKMDLKWQLALLSMRTRKFSRKLVERLLSMGMTQLDMTSQSFMADEEVPTNMALMAFSDSQPGFEGYGPKTSKSVSEDTSNEVRESLDASLVEELVSNDKLEKKTIFPTIAKINFVRPQQQENPVRKPVKYAEMYSFDHVQTNCNYHQRERMVSGNNYTRVNYNYSAKKAHPSAHMNIFPRAVLMKTGLRPLNTARPKAVNTARPNSVVVNVVRSNQGHLQKEDKGYVDSRCSRHMTGNMSYLSDFKEFDGGYVSFRGGAKGGRITGKGTLKTETNWSEGFQEIVDFLNNSYIRYALTKNPTIYVSLIEKFWQTATVRTVDNGEQEITATVDGKEFTITEASVRRHLQLADVDGISVLLTTKIFDQLSLMGYVLTDDKLTFQKGLVSLLPKVPLSVIYKEWYDKVERDTTTAARKKNVDAEQASWCQEAMGGSIAQTRSERVPTPPCDSPLPRVYTLGSDEGSMTLQELMILCTTLSKKVESLEADLKQTKKVYGAAYTKLIKKVKKLEKTVKSNQARRRAKIVVSDDEEDLEDSSKQGRMIEEIDQDVGVTLMHLRNVQTYTRRRRAVSTGSGELVLYKIRNLKLSRSREQIRAKNKIGALIEKTLEQEFIIADEEYLEDFKKRIEERTSTSESDQANMLVFVDLINQRMK